jgi:hypothetical protein
MTKPLTAAVLPSFSTKLRELLDLLAALRDIRDPLTSPEGLRASLELLLRLAEFVGVDRAWTGRIRTILDDPRVFDIVLAIVRYLQGLMETEQVIQLIAENDTADVQRLAAETDLAAQDFLDWLPLILEIIALLREFRRGTSAAD